VLGVFGVVVFRLKFEQIKKASYISGL